MEPYSILFYFRGLVARKGMINAQLNLWGGSELK